MEVWDTVIWLVVVALVILVLLLLFPQIQEISIGAVRVRRVHKEWREDLQKIPDAAKRAGIANLRQVGKTVKVNTDTSGRDVILASWGSLKQTVYDAAVAQKISLTHATPTADIIRELKKSGLIGMAEVQLLQMLFRMGQALVDQKRLRPSPQEASTYKGYADYLVNWIVRNVLTPKKEEPPAPPRRTRVGGYFPPPSPGRPTAKLMVTSGPMQGKQFMMEKDVLTLGSGTENDIVVTGDEFVSSEHAVLRYREGSLLLSDRGSRNGTFIGDRQITRSASILSSGDSMRLGSTWFRVTMVPG
jgi:hypothetical protein